MDVTYHGPNKEQPVFLKNISCILEGTHTLSRQPYVWKALWVGSDFRYGGFGSHRMSKTWYSTKNPIFWATIPYRPMKVNRLFGETYRLHLLAACFLLVSRVAYFSTLKLEAICSSETTADSQLAIRLYIPEDKTPHRHRCENLKSNITLYFVNDDVIIYIIIFYLALSVMF
jgi:hypothetical protein